MLEIRNIKRQFGDYVALNDLSLTVESGEFFTLLGPSGCGKTTLLRMIAGFDEPDAGELLLEGKSLVGIPPEKRPIRTVFQNYALFPHMTIAQNVAFPLQMARVDKQDIAKRVEEALINVRLPDKANQYPDALSGGQKQRIAIARALVNRPRLLLLDEPLSALDAQMREQMQIELINLQREIGITFVYVTHDQGEALALSHRIAVMNQGELAQVAEPSQLYSYPTSRFVADFIGQCNILDGEIEALEDNKVSIALNKLGSVNATMPKDATFKSGDACALTIRPEKIRIAAQIEPDSTENHFKGQVISMLYLGDVTVYRVQIAEGIIIEAQLANTESGRARFFEVDDQVEVAWHPAAAHMVSA